MQHFARPHDDFLTAVFPNEKPQRAVEDVGKLLVLVRVLGHDTPPLQVHMRQHHTVATNAGARRPLAARLASACTGWAQAAHGQVTPVPASRDRKLGGRVIEAHYVVAGRLEKVDRANLYGQRGGWLMRALFRDEGPPDASEAKIAVDSVLVGGGQPKRLYITFFAPHGNRIPTVGENAIWIAHQRQLWRFAQATVYGAPYDIGLALDSDDDIRPVGEWSLLRTVALKLQLSHVW